MHSHKHTGTHMAHTMWHTGTPPFTMLDISPILHPPHVSCPMTFKQHCSRERGTERARDRERGTERARTVGRGGSKGFQGSLFQNTDQCLYKFCPPHFPKCSMPPSPNPPAWSSIPVSITSATLHSHSLFIFSFQFYSLSRSLFLTFFCHLTNPPPSISLSPHFPPVRAAFLHLFMLISLSLFPLSHPPLFPYLSPHPPLCSDEWLRGSIRRQPRDWSVSQQEILTPPLLLSDHWEARASLIPHNAAWSWCQLRLSANTSLGTVC